MIIGDILSWAFFLLNVGLIGFLIALLYYAFRFFKKNS